jgi:hypothetical protein
MTEKKVELEFLGGIVVKKKGQGAHISLFNGDLLRLSIQFISHWVGVVRLKFIEKLS